MWPSSPDELIEIQRALARAMPDPWPAPESAATSDASTRSATIGACVVLFPRGETERSHPSASGDPAWAGAAVLRRGQVLGQAVVSGVAGGPYLPGLLALREGPRLEAALRALPVVPNVVLVDATGRDHPRRAGLALQLGAVVGIPTVGVTHRPLMAAGEWPEDARGATSPLLLDGEPVGAWLRTRRGARPLAVHPGWRTTLEVAIDVVLTASGAHRTPEPIRVARRLARIARSNAGQ